MDRGNCCIKFYVDIVILDYIIIIIIIIIIKYSCFDSKVVLFIFLNVVCALIIG